MFKYKFSVSKMMKRFGLTLNLNVDAEILKALSENASLEFENMEILQSFCIAVDEHGTEAAAVTYEENMTCSMYYPPPVDFIADNPFVFMIREDSSGTPHFSWSCGQSTPGRIF